MALSKEQLELARLNLLGQKVVARTVLKGSSLYEGYSANNLDNIIDDMFHRVTEHFDALEKESQQEDHQLAEKLIQRVPLSPEEIKALMAGEKE